MIQLSWFRKSVFVVLIVALMTTLPLPLLAAFPLLSAPVSAASQQSAEVLAEQSSGGEMMSSDSVFDSDVISVTVETENHATRALQSGPLALYLPLIVTEGSAATLTLEAIGNQSVLLGSTLNLALSADGSGSLTFGVSPLPLPDNASFNAMSGVFTFSPVPEQTGELELTFSVTVGSQSDSETVTITVPEADPSDETALRGRILDANDSTEGIITPLVGATVTHIESGMSTTTDSDGYFTLSGLPAGASHFEYDARTVAPAGTYGAYRGEKELIANVTNVISRPIYIMRIDTAGEVDVDPNDTTVVNNPNIDTTVTIPPHTVMDESGNEFDGMISISPVPAAFTPGSLPDTLEPDQVITVQPMGLTFQTPAPVTFPNTSGLSAGSEVDIWSMDHSTSEFFVAGTGRVTDDGTMIETIEGGIREASWHFPLPPAPSPQPPPDGPDNNNPPPDPCNSANAASTVTLYNGCVGTRVSVPPYLSLGESRALEFVYQSDRAYPQPLIPFQATLLETVAVPSQISYGLSIGGAVSGNRVFLGTNTLSEDNDEPFRGSLLFDGSTSSTGVYPHIIRVTSHYENAAGSSNIRGNTLIVNEQNSPFGAGWAIAGLQRLYVQPDGNALLTDGNGAARLYQDPFAGFLIEIGQVVNGEISVAGEFDVYSFVAEAGQQVYFDQQGYSGIRLVDWQVVDEDGAVIFDTCLGCGDPGVRTLQRGGTYTLMVGEDANEQTGTYQFQLWNVPSPDQFSIEIGDIVSDGNPAAGAGNIETPGVKDIYTFTATPGQQVYFDQQGHSGTRELDWQVVDEDGTIIFDTCLGCGDPGVRILQRGGTYTLTVGEDAYEQTGTYQFQLWNVPPADEFSISIGDIVSDGNPAAGAGNIETPGVKDIYTFTATPGQQVYFDEQGYSDLDLVDWRVVDEEGSVIFVSCFDCQPGVRTLERGGTYILTVGDDRDDGVGTYQFQIWNVPPADQFSISIGDMVSDGNPAVGAGNIETPGVKDIYTFSATPGQQVYFDQQGYSGVSLVDWQVVDEDGTVLFDSCFGCIEQGLQLLERGGTYILTVGDDRDDQVGTYQFQLWNVPSPDQFSISIGDIVSDGNPAAGAGNIETPGVKDIYTFTATPGQQVYFDEQGYSGVSQVDWQVVDEDGTVIFHTCFGCSEPGVQFLERGGTYILTVGDDREDAVGTYQFQIIDQTGQVYGHPEEILETTSNYRTIPARYAKASFSSGLENVVVEAEPVAQPDGIEGTRFDETTAGQEAINFTSPDGDFSILTQNEDGTFTLRMKDGTEYHFNANGYQTSMVDRNGNTTTYSYDANGRLTSMTDPAGLVTTLTYSSGRLSRVTDPTGRETAFEHDANGNLVRVTLPDGEQQAFAYDSRHLMTSETDRRGFMTTRTYDQWGRLASASLPDGTVRQATYSQSVGLVDPSSGVGSEENPAPVVRPEDAVSTLTDGEGRTTTYNIGSLGRFAGITDAAGFTTAISRDDDGNPLQTTRPSGAIFRRTYDGQGNQLTFSDETVDGTTSYSYENTFNQVTSITDPFDEVTNLEYDNQGNPTQISTPLGRAFSFDYDSRGLLTNLTDPLSTESAFSYDKQGNLTEVVQGAEANQRSATLTYTPAGYVERITDPLGRTFDFSYDALGRLTSESLPANRTIAYQYDADSNLSALTPPGKPAHAFDYNELGFMTAYIPPTVDGSGSTRTTYQYNNAQELTQITRPDGKELTYSYDDAGRLTTLTMPRGPYTYGYDANTGQLVTTGTPESINLTYGYDGELLTNVTWSGPIAGSISRTYDANYRTTSLSVNGNAISYQYDADDALTQAGSLNLTYDDTSGLLTSTDLTQVNDSYNYNQFAELDNYSATYNSLDLYQTSYTRDKLGRITELTETIDGTTATYTYSYDTAGRLAQVERNGTSIATYSYDANGNRLTHTDASGTTNGTYDDQDRLLTYGANTYAYTANGELTTKTNGGETTTYNYDVLGNLMAVTLPDSTQIEYLVDGQDRRIGKKTGGTLVQGWLYEDGLNPIAELDASGNVLTRFVYASMSNVPDYMTKNGTTYRIISDHLGSVRLVVNTQTGDIAQRIDYDAFGNVTQDTNPGFQPFGFAGGLYDTDTGLVRFGARDYDAETGRWTAKDPIGFEDGGNLYGYARNNPLHFIDLSGSKSDRVEPGTASTAGSVSTGIQQASGVGKVFSAPFKVINKALSGEEVTQEDIDNMREQQREGLKDVITAPLGPLGKFFDLFDDDGDGGGDGEAGGGNNSGSDGGIGPGGSGGGAGGSSGDDPC